MHLIRPFRPVTFFILAAVLLSACARQAPPDAAPTRQAGSTSPGVLQPIMVEMVSYAPGQTEAGLYLAAGVDVDTEMVFPDGFTRPAVRSGNGAALPSRDGNTIPDSYIQFQVSDGILYRGLPTKWASIEVEYLDDGADSFSLEYDAFAGAFTPFKPVDKTASGEIRSAVFLLCDAYFANRTNTADFRILDLGDGPETVFSVTLRLQPVLDDAAALKSATCEPNPSGDQPAARETPPPRE